MNELEELVKEIETPLTQVLVKQLRSEIAYKMANNENHDEPLNMYIEITGGNNEYNRTTEQATTTTVQEYI